MDGDRSFKVTHGQMSRRDLVSAGAVAGLGVGFALAVQPVQAQTIIKTADGKEMPAYRAMPASGTGMGTILVVHEAWGVHAHIADICRRFAKAGWCALAPELWFRQGDPRNAPDTQTIIRDIMAKVPDAQVLSDLDASTALVKGEGRANTAKLGVTGFCWGGRIAWLYAAHNPGLKAGVAWYGAIAGNASPLRPTNPIDIVKDLKGPVLGLYGGADTFIPGASVERMRAALEAATGNPAAKKSMIHTYPDAPHAFNADYRDSYRKEAAEDGWKRCTEWFKANGV